jgi:hypothetical protein
VAHDLLGVAGESGMTDTNESACPHFLRAGVVHAVHLSRLEFPADDGVERVGPTGFPGVNQQARRIDLQVFAFHTESFAVGGDAAADPFSAGTKITG